MNEEKLEDFSINQLMRKKFRVCHSFIQHCNYCEYVPCVFYYSSQEEKAVLKAKADADAELQARASIDIPLVDEKQEDVRKAKSTNFATGSSLTERKRKRREIKSQSVFGDAYSPNTKISRHTLLKTGVRLDGSVFSSARHGKTGTSQSLKDHRKSLGIRPTSSSSS